MARKIAVDILRVSILDLMDCRVKTKIAVDILRQKNGFNP